MLSESFGTRRNHSKPYEDQCYGWPCQPATHNTNTWLCQPATHNTSTWLCQPAKHNTNTWLCQPVAHKHESESKVWIDGRLDGYVDGWMEMDRWIDGRTDDKNKHFFAIFSPDGRTPKPYGLIDIEALSPLDLGCCSRLGLLVCVRMFGCVSLGF